MLNPSPSKEAEESTNQVQRPPPGRISPQSTDITPNAGPSSGPLQLIGQPDHYRPHAQCITSVNAAHSVSMGFLGCSSPLQRPAEQNPTSDTHAHTRFLVDLGLDLTVSGSALF